MDECKYLILDFGKVLAAPASRDWFLTPKFLELVDMNLFDLSDYKVAFEKTRYLLDLKLVNEREEYEMFCQFYGNILKDVKYPKFSWDMVSEIASNFAYESDKYQFYDGVVDELDKLSREYILLLLSDNWPSLVRIMKEKGIYDFFKKVYISSFYGEKKENGIFFDYLINDFLIKDNEALFIDDTEELLDVAVKKKLKVRRMDREKEIQFSKYKIIHDLNDLE